MKQWHLALAVVAIGANLPLAKLGAQQRPTSAQTVLQREAKIAETDARKTALAAVPGGRVQSH